MPSDLPEQSLDVLRLHRDDDERCARDGVLVRQGRVDAVPLAKLGDPLGASSGRCDLRGFSPAGGEEPR